MSAIFEQAAGTAEWQPGKPHHPDARLGPNGEKRAGNRALATNALTRNHRRAVLSQVVEAEILPRLVAARGVAANRSGAVGDKFVTTEADLNELVRLVLVQEAAGAVAFMEQLQRRGATPATLYLGMLSQAARRLGEFWEDDRADFAQVTISMGRLQQIVRALAPRFQMAAVTRPNPETVMLVTPPGGQHTFGLVILAEFFRREGWHVIGGPVPCGDERLANLVRDSWVDVAGFSIGSAGQLEALGKSIRLVRRLSRNRDLGVMVGGPLLLVRPDLVARIGADMTATDAESAVRQANGLLAVRMAAD